MKINHLFASKAPVASTVAADGIDGVKHVILQNCAIYSAFERAYREGGRTEFADSIAEFVAAHGKLLRAFDEETQRDLLERSFDEGEYAASSFGEQGYQRAELPPMLELTEEDMAMGAVSARALLNYPHPAEKTYAVSPDGTVSFIQSIKGWMGEMLAARDAQF
jgi:hypothetical protein